MLLASGVIAALAVAIICVKIPSRPEFGKLKTAKGYIGRVIHNAFHIEFHLLLHRI